MAPLQLEAPQAAQPEAAPAAANGAADDAQHTQNGAATGAEVPGAQTAREDEQTAADEVLKLF